MKKLAIAVIVLLVLLVLLFAADRAVESVAQDAVAEDVRVSAGLAAAPEVDLGGFPFLHEAVRGRYERISVTARDVPAGEVVLQRLDAVLLGAQVPLSDALSDTVSRIPVDLVTARAVVSYDELEEASRDRRLTFEPDDDRLRVTGFVEVFGQELSAVAVSRLDVVDGELVVTAESFEVGNGAADSLLTGALQGRFDVRVPVQGLPYGLTVTGVRVGEDGVVIFARAEDTVLETPARP